MDGDDLLGLVLGISFGLGASLLELDEESGQQEDYAAVVDGQLHLNQAIQVELVYQLHLHLLLALAVPLQALQLPCGGDFVVAGVELVLKIDGLADLGLVVDEQADPLGVEPHQIGRPDRNLKLISLVEDHGVLEEGDFGLECDVVELILDAGLVGAVVGVVECGEAVLALEAVLVQVELVDQLEVVRLPVVLLRLLLDEGAQRLAGQLHELVGLARGQLVLDLVDVVLPELYLVRVVLRLLDLFDYRRVVRLG